MSRNRGSKCAGGSWTEAEKDAVWEKGKPIPGLDSNIWRSDICGSRIRYIDHGNIETEFGWEIDHIRPCAEGGTDSLYNLQPLQWENNRSKGDSLDWNCP